MSVRKSLSDILRAGDRDRIASTWKSTQAADDFKPLPGGEYIARIENGEFEASRTKGTPGYKLTFLVIEGEHDGRRFWHDLWLTEAALPMTKRDLSKIGVESIEQLEQPLPQGMVCRVKLALRREDDGAEYNRVRTFDVIRVDKPEVEPFAPTSPAEQEVGE